MHKISNEKNSFIDRFVRNFRSLQRLFLGNADKSYKAKQGNDLWCPEIPWQCFLSIFLILVTAVGRKPKSEICFLLGWLN